MPDTLRIKALLSLSKTNSGSQKLSLIQEAYNLSLRIKNEGLQATCLNDLGYAYIQLKDYNKAIESLLKAIELGEKNSNNKNLSSSFDLIAKCYNFLGDYNTAMIYRKKALQIDLIRKDPNVLSASYNNIASQFLYSSQYDSAIYYYIKSLELFRKLNDYSNSCITLSNLGSVYFSQKKYNLAAQYYEECIVYANKNNDQENLAINLNNLGEVYSQINQPKKAEEAVLKSLSLAKEIKADYIIPYTYENLTRIYTQLKDYEKALEYQGLYITIKDSIYNAENSQKLQEMLVKFETEKKENQIKLQSAEIQQSKLVKNGLIILVVFVLLVALVIFNSYRNKHKANLLITRQKEEILSKNEELNQQNEEILAQRDEIENKSVLLEDKNKEIIDSIKYAKRLQEAILPPDLLVKEILGNSFVLYKPKDIVSGDFYWIDEDKDSVYVAVADCTGHGVPGAFMSIVGFNLLKHAIHEHNKTRPAEILNQVNIDLSKSLRQSYQESTIKDGMDIALCCLSKKENRFEFAGANNSVYLVRDGELTEFKPDKQPVGIFLDEELKSFTNKTIEIKKDDVFYLFSDGYADQFGGPKGKKFKYKQLEELLLQISQKPMAEQKQILNTSLEEWKGELPQTDDICIVGFRI